MRKFFNLLIDFGLGYDFIVLVFLGLVDILFVFIMCFRKEIFFWKRLYFLGEILRLVFCSLFRIVDNLLICWLKVLEKIYGVINV